MYATLVYRKLLELCTLLIITAWAGGSVKVGGAETKLLMKAACIQ